MPQAELPTVVVDSSSPGRFTLDVDGVDISNGLVNVAIESPAGQVPTVVATWVGGGFRVLFPSANVVVQEVHPEGTVAPSDSVADWLSRVDAEQFNRVLAAESEFAEPIGETALRVLRAFAERED